MDMGSANRLPPDASISASLATTLLVWMYATAGKLFAVTTTIIIGELPLPCGTFGM